MKKLKLILKIIKMTNVDKIILTYLLFIAICSFILILVEPHINNFGDGLWYCFVAFTTIGFGDITVTTIIGRIITILVSLYGMIVIALITGVLVDFYQEILKIKARESVQEFLDKLEQLPDLSKDELKKISETVKKRKYKI